MRVYARWVDAVAASYVLWQLYIVAVAITRGEASLQHPLDFCVVVWLAVAALRPQGKLG